jgi:hypothetical protein
MLFVVMVTFFGAILLGLSDRARDFADERIQGEARAFAANPTLATVDAPTEARALMSQITAQGYEIRHDGFLPTARRVDLLLGSQDGERYRLIAVKNWNGTLRISLRRLSHDER